MSVAKQTNATASTLGWQNHNHYHGFFSRPCHACGSAVEWFGWELDRPRCPYCRAGVEGSTEDETRDETEETNP